MPPKLPSIPMPQASLPALFQTAVTTKEVAEVLGGVRGPKKDAAVTWGDLVRLGLITADKVPK